MQETRWNDDEYLSGPKSLKDLERAMHDRHNRTVALHKPGAIVELGSGARYEVQADGSWRRLALEPAPPCTDPACNEKPHRPHTHGGPAMEKKS